MSHKSTVFAAPLSLPGIFAGFLCLRCAGSSSVADAVDDGCCGEYGFVVVHCGSGRLQLLLLLLPPVVSHKVSVDHDAPNTFSHGDVAIDGHWA